MEIYIICQTANDNDQTKPNNTKLENKAEEWTD